MTDAIRPLIAGNWKMNGLKSSLAEFEAMIAGAGALAGKADLLFCPPATLIAGFADKALGSKLAVGAQDCHPEASGAHTGDLSAESGDGRQQFVHDDLLPPRRAAARRRRTCDRVPQHRHR